MNVKSILASVNYCAAVMYVCFKPTPPLISLWTFLSGRKTRTKGTDRKDTYLFQFVQRNSPTYTILVYL